MSGRIAYYGGIIKEGLVLNLDAAKQASYPKSGTDWYDLSGNTYNATLINGTAFTKDNGGAFTFDGIDDYGRIPYNSNFDLSNTDYTLEGWFNSNSYSSDQILISKDTYGQNFDWALYVFNSTTLIFYSNVTATNVTATVPAMSNGQWYHYVVTSISGTIRIYLNSVLYQTDTMSTSDSSQVYVTIGRYSWNDPDDPESPGVPAVYINGYIAALRIYRKGLTDYEVLQNYNAYKGKFNL